MPPEIMKHKVDQTLIALRQADPQATVAAIVRTAEAAEARRAEVEFDPEKTDIEALKLVVIGLDYKVEVEVEAAPEIKFAEDFKINITGMTCSSCAGRVEAALNTASGVAGASVTRRRSAVRRSRRLWRMRVMAPRK